VTGVLLGPGELAEAFAWDGPEMAALLAGEGTGGPVESALAAASAVVAYTRSASVLDALARRARRLVSHDPAPPAGGAHASLWLAAALGPLGIGAAPEPEPMRFTEAETLEAGAATSSLPPGFLAVHPGSGSPAKNWPFDRFVEAARRLASGWPWLLVLGPAEEGRVVPDGVATPGDRLPEPSPSLGNAVVARALPLRRLATVLSRAGLYLGNDSGASHLAAACGTRTLALFGPTDPAQWSPVGRAVRTLRSSTGRLEDLAVDEVVAAARDCGRMR